MEITQEQAAIILFSMTILFGMMTAVFAMAAVTANKQWERVMCWGFAAASAFVSIASMWNMP